MAPISAWFWNSFWLKAETAFLHSRKSHSSFYTRQHLKDLHCSSNCDIFFFWMNTGDWPVSDGSEKKKLKEMTNLGWNASPWGFFTIHVKLCQLVSWTKKRMKHWMFPPVIASNGRRIKTESQLNMSCTVAPAKALRNWFLSPDWVRETMVLVTEVPMFAPIIIGMAGLTWSTIKMTRIYKHIHFVQNLVYLKTDLFFSKSACLTLYLLPEATIVTTIDVEVLELCTKTVDRIPIIKPATGFWRSSFEVKASPKLWIFMSIIRRVVSSVSSANTDEIRFLTHLQFCLQVVWRQSWVDPVNKWRWTTMPKVPPLFQFLPPKLGAVWNSMKDLVSNKNEKFTYIKGFFKLKFDRVWDMKLMVSCWKNYTFTKISQRHNCNNQLPKGYNVWHSVWSNRLYLRCSS